MTEIEQARQWAKENLDRIEDIQTRTGLRFSWLSQFASGRIKNPSAQKYLELTQYIKEHGND